MWHCIERIHVPVFDGRQLDPLKMIRMAHDMQLDALPPLASIRVVEEDLGKAGVDYFDVADRERLFDSPFAIGRLVKSKAYQKRIVLAARGEDLNDRPLKLHWLVLRGDEKRIKITRQDPRGERVEIQVAHHDPTRDFENEKVKPSRVDIAVFADNGKYFSSPAILSLYYSRGEKRVYDKDQRIQSIDYAAAAKEYIDPLIEVRKDWRDEYEYDKQGRLLGWTRTRKGKTTAYTPDGRRVLARARLEKHERPPPQFGDAI